MENAEVKKIKIEVVPGYPQTVKIYRNQESGQEFMRGAVEAVTRALSERGWPLGSPTTEVGSWTVVKREKNQ